MQRAHPAEGSKNNRLARASYKIFISSKLFRSHCDSSGLGLRQSSLLLTPIAEELLEAPRHRAQICREVETVQ